MPFARLRWAAALPVELSVRSDIFSLVATVDWSNPQWSFVFDVMDVAHTVSWEIQMASPSARLLGEWKIDTFKPGDRGVANLYRARDCSRVGFARNIAKLAP